ncbi:hypothetical protein BK007_02050 [Methanobacterium subterraneum]|uniref:site-specific DNA-methyltransferase (adenine-specific) n=1 Tax=Methanobacterium subterraneum TaxID=59277 RepID=A0A2H4VA02_9EURY|nr:DNA methyltransferase [Methanobacterium subterraneum]AUB54921.1 hypothetical protein BK007_02050 [Methanobacterium subterraneum]
MSIELKKRIKNHLCNLKSAKDIFELFRLLNYPENVFYDTSYKREIDDFNFRKEDSSRIAKIYSILNFEDNLPVFLLETTSLSPSFIRSVAKKFDSQYLRFLIILVDENYSEMVFVLPDREKVDQGKYRLKITKLIINKEDIKERNEYYTVIDTLSKIRYENEPHWRDIWLKWKESFDVEKVTKAFFDDYKAIFFKLRKSIQTSLVSPKGAHEYTLQFLNRVMFIYFISKKGWLKYPKFMHWFWKSYKKDNKFGSNEFHEKWLNQVFFKGFNNQGHDVTGLPQYVNEVITSFPYLNGGLFKENKVDKCPVKINDELFQKIFEFFEKYNFTIKEDMPLESEVAVDPQMIGYVYETLASLSSKDVDIYTESEKKDDAESRRKWGIFYTPIIEVDFMCRRSLVEYLDNNLSELPKKYIYHFVFDAPGEFNDTEKYLTQENWWDQIEDTLDNLSIVDPACGSGAFLVGMMNILGELYGKVYKHTDTDLDDYQMKYRIIQRSLYGVDVMKWAVDAAELRLWLQLIIETTIKGDELKKSPLLPNLNLNLRVGDSLVQEIGGISFNVRSNEIDAKLKKKLEELKKEKANYFENPQKAKYKSSEDFHKQELKLFNSIIGSRINILQKENEIKMKGTETKQITLGAKTTTKAKKFDDKTNKKILSEIKENKKQIQNLRKMKKALKNSDKKPFVWEIDFAEIFGDKNGFDIVIGNPPYIMHENISPPNRIKSERLKKYKSAYKAKLLKSSKNLFPSIKKIDGKSDYYIYFFFHGLGLLNEKGTFCFITSNSWLDAKYGASLQEFLLNKVPIIAIYDNNKKRSFAHADINTVISLFGNPLMSYSNSELRSEEEIGIKINDNTVKFVIFKKPYENVINSHNLIEIEETKADVGNELKDLLKNLVDKTNFRVFPIAQKDLLHDGWVYPEKYDSKRGRFKAGSYNGNKWNSKFLRAPKIFYTILEKGEFKNLESLGHIETYLNTGGADKFYFVDLLKRGEEYSEIENKEFNERFKIETKFIQPMVKSPQELSKILIEDKDLKSNIILLNEKEKIKNLFIEKYIEFGELKEYNTRSGPSNRSPWWKLPKQAREGGEILFPRNYNNRLLAFYNPQKYISNRFYRFKTTQHDKLIYILNSTLNILMMEIFGKTNLGEGALELGKPEIRLLPILKLNIDFKDNNILKRDSMTIYEECGFNILKPLREQDPKPLSDRAELDNVIFEELGLSEEERKEVYWSVCELVKNRLDKAKSLNG